ncbi:MAG: hypothetical protein HeimC2_05710 [Candidatus Heimdallarchaeota archaeon LC_2]|nr:MAG: hypothetical protein HeimC2_05710 [Candidatus Heimdallarchaeota archaeon LC_2]
MSEEQDKEFPNTRRYSHEIIIDEKVITLQLFVVEYQNALQVAVYDQQPTLGSMSFGYFVGDVTQHLEIFTGNHNQFSNVLASVLANKTKKLVYASVNLKNEIGVDISTMKKLLDKYLEDTS